MDASSLEIKRGEEAAYILAHPLMVGAFEKVKDGITDAMRNSPMGDEKLHNRLVIALQIANQVEKNLKDYVTTGKMATIQLNEGRISKLKRAVVG